MTQGAGSAIAASGNFAGTSKDIGIGVLIGGLALQLGTFTLFLRGVWMFASRVTSAGDFRKELNVVLGGVWVAGCSVEVH